MKKLNLRKILVLGSSIAVSASIMVAFQNFTPHEPLKGKDGSDLFLNGALTDALASSEKEHKANQVAMNKDESELLKKGKKIIQVDVGLESDDEDSTREPASVMDEKIDLHN